MRIEKGDYIAKEDITSEAIHALVVKCFEAAGFKKPEKSGNFKAFLNDGLCVCPDGEVMWGANGYSAKRRLTLQQLLTAENSIKWPDWAVDVQLVAGASMFTDGNEIAERVAGGCTIKYPSGIDDCKILATRAKPEQGWFDYNIHKAINPAPTGTKLIVDCLDKGWRHAVVIGSFERWSWLDIDGIGLDTVDLWRIKPIDHATRKQDQERQEFVEKASEIVGYDERLRKLFDAGCRFTK